MKLATRETCPGAARWGVIATLVLAPLTQALALSYTCAGGQTQTSFTDASPPGTSTGTVQSFTVPPEVTDITIDAAGAQGGDGGSGGGAGGHGAEVVTDVAVLEGQILCVLVGIEGKAVAAAAVSCT